MLGPPFDELGEHHDRLFEYLLTDFAGLAALGDVDEGAVAISDTRLMLFGNAQEVADGPHRHHRPEIRDEIETAGADQRIQLPGAEFAHQRLHREHAPGREDPGQQAAVQIVQRRILEKQDARRHLDVVEEDVSGGAAAGSVSLPVRQFARHVLVSTQRIEVVLFVVVQRRFFAHPLPHRVRVVIDVGIVWVVIQLDRFGVCQRPSLQSFRCRKPCKIAWMSSSTITSLDGGLVPK